MQEYSLTVLPEQAGMRLDLFLLEFSGRNNLGLSRTFIQKLIQEGSVIVDGIAAKRQHSKVKPSSSIKVLIEDKAPLVLAAENIPLNIVYDDLDLAVINKPQGMVVHPAPGNLEHTLVNALLYHFKELSDVNPQRPGIVHRLDKETSGLLVIAKNNFTHLGLAMQFERHTIKRRYLAVVKGEMEFKENIIELPIGRHPVKRKSMSVSFSDNTKYAKTYYRTLKSAKDYSVLELEPFTGRTHQLRVHLAFLNHPILGDTKYGKTDSSGRLLLHAKTLWLMHPRLKKVMEFDSELPEDFDKFIKSDSSPPKAK